MKLAPIAMQKSECGNWEVLQLDHRTIGLRLRLVRTFDLAPL
jgi:hypothetical protein